LPVALDRSSKIQLLSQGTLIAIFTFILVIFVIPGINANSDEIDVNKKEIYELNSQLNKIDIEEIDATLKIIDQKLDKIVLAMCGEFGGKYCE